MLEVQQAGRGLVKGCSTVGIVLGSYKMDRARVGLGLRCWSLSGHVCSRAPKSDRLSLESREGSR